MMLSIRIVAFIHLAVYVAIIIYGWQSYKKLRKPSWKVMGIGFVILLVYRMRQFIRQMIVDYPIDTESTLVPFVASVVLLVAFRMMRTDSEYIVSLMGQVPVPLQSGAQPVEFWLEKFRTIVREEITAASGTTTVTVKGPSATDAAALKEK